MASKIINNIRWFLPSQDREKNSEYDEIVVSSRIRIARNLADLPFELKMKHNHCEHLLELLTNVLTGKLKGKFFGMENLSMLDKESLLECYLISPAFLKSEKPSALFITERGNVTVMINEEDHLRIQSLSHGLNFPEIASEAFEVETTIGEELIYAFDKKYGFLTSCPTNIGTGLRASVLLHLPALVFTNEVEKVLKGAVQIGMAVRGLFGEGSDTKGNLFQISNQQTLGMKEEELIDTIVKLAHMIIDIEMKARDVIMNKARYEFEDKVARSLAVLRSARIISSDGVLNLVSGVRFGVGTGFIKDVELDTLNEIILVSRPANIQIYFGEVLEEYERDVKRAEYIRKRLQAEKK